MPTHNSVAASARRSKERNPEFYCPVRECLWRTYDARSDSFTKCGKHGMLHPLAEKREELDSVDSDMDDYERDIAGEFDLPDDDDRAYEAAVANDNPLSEEFYPEWDGDLSQPFDTPSYLERYLDAAAEHHFDPDEF